MDSKVAQEVLALYAAIMTEVKIRFECIEHVVQGKTELDHPLVCEIAYLQLRMICELVALGCLVVHGDIPATQTSKFQRAFSANAILKGLESLHPDFFPKPLTQAHHTSRLHFEPRQPDYMTKDELLTLYGEQCGNALHKGSLHGLLTAKKQPRDDRYPEIMGPAQRLVNLLEIHRMPLLSGDQFLSFQHYGPERVVHTLIGGTPQA